MASCAVVLQIDNGSIDWPEVQIKNISGVLLWCSS